MASGPQMTEMYDHALLGVLQHVGNIQDFLQVYFGFLYRKTDFYRLLARPTDRMGFPPGVAQTMVLKTFKLFERLAEQDRERQQREEETRAAVPPTAIQEVEVESPQQKEVAGEATTTTTTSSSSSESTAVAAHKTEASTSAQAMESSSSSSSGPQLVPSGSAPVLQTSQRDQTPAASASSAADAGQDKFQSNPESYNGAVRENYTWSQDYTDVEVRVNVPKTVVKGRQVVVSLQSSSVRVCLKNGAEENVLVEGELTHKINPEDSLWNLEPGRCVVLTLSKIGEVWWSALLKGEPEIDIQAINRERSMATVGEDEHAVLDRLTFDYNQKLQGKPQSHEMKVHEMLKKGWDAEGSPFRGQEFDPTMFDIPPSAVQF